MSVVAMLAARRGRRRAPAPARGTAWPPAAAPRRSGPGRRLLRVVAAHALGDVFHGRGEGDAAGFLAQLGAAHAVGHHDQVGQPLVAVHELGEALHAALEHLGALVQRGHDEVVLVLLPLVADVREAPRVDLVVERLADGGVDGGGGRGHEHSCPVGGEPFGPDLPPPILRSAGDCRDGPGRSACAYRAPRGTRRPASTPK